MGNRFSAVSLKACDLISDRGHDRSQPGLFHRTLQKHALTLQSVFECRLSRVAKHLVHQTQREVIVIQAAC